MTKYIIAALAGVVAALVITIFIPPEPAPTSGRKANVSRREVEARDRIDALIKGLRSPNPEDRAIFHRNLIEETGMFFEFKPAALPEEREAAFRRWEEWWSVNRDKTREQWLIDSLSLEDYGGKPLTLKNLVEMSSQASVPAIIAILDDPQPLLRADAVRALGRLKAPEAADRLIEALETDENLKVRRAAARSLGQIGSKEALSALVRTTGQEDMLTRIEAASALMIHAHAHATTVLHSMLADGDRNTVQFAIARLGELRNPESVMHLARMLDMPGTPPSMKEKAQKALQAIVGENLGAEAGPWIEWYEKHKQPEPNPM